VDRERGSSAAEDTTRHVFPELPSVMGEAVRVAGVHWRFAVSEIRYTDISRIPLEVICGAMGQDYIKCAANDVRASHAIFATLGPPPPVFFK